MDEIEIEERAQIIRQQTGDMTIDQCRAIARGIYDPDFEEERISWRLYFLVLFDWYTYPLKQWVRRKLGLKPLEWR